ncbi:MAG: M15 family metallopeptidase [Chthoniobacterales bacterium]
MNLLRRGFVILGCCASAARLACAQTAQPDLVNVKKIEPTIIVQLRYATENNLAHHAIYPANMPALVRSSVAERLVFAQKFLRTQGFGLKIWDAYRPKSAQERLWEAAKNEAYLSDPNGSVGSMHTRGVAVDATLVDSWGRDVAMPTDFDSFTPAAMLFYQGNDRTVRWNLTLLQRAMARAGFYGLRTEWWHFCAEDWKSYPPVTEVQFVAGAQPRPL